MKRVSYLDMIQAFLTPEEFGDFKEQYEKPIKKSIKILNSHKESTLSRLTSEGRILTPPRFSWDGRTYDDVLFVEKPGKESLGSHPLHQEGSFYVQEMAAGLSAQVLMTHGRSEIVLDLCAAPGGKSIQLADFLSKTGKTGIVISNEPDPHRRKALEANLERCGITNILITGYDGRQLGDILSEQCDKVLVDAPCSGEGMQYKKDCKIYQRNIKKVKKLTQLQRELFISAFKALKIGGELVYSTCTTNTFENEGNVCYFLKQFAGMIELMEIEIAEKSVGKIPTENQSITDNFNPSFVARFWPHIHHTGGFFIAKFKKTASTSDITMIEYTNSYKPSIFTEISKDSLGEGFRDIQEDIIFLASKHTLRATISPVLPLLNQLYVQKVGLPVAKILQDGSFKPIPANLAKIQKGTAG